MNLTGGIDQYISSEQFDQELLWGGGDLRCIVRSLGRQIDQQDHRGSVNGSQAQAWVGKSIASAVGDRQCNLIQYQHSKMSGFVRFSVFGYSDKRCSTVLFSLLCCYAQGDPIIIKLHF